MQKTQAVNSNLISVPNSFPTTHTSARANLAHFKQCLKFTLSGLQKAGTGSTLLMPEQGMLR